MSRSRTLFTAAGLRITVHPTSFVAVPILALILALAGLLLIPLPLVEAIIFGILAALLHVIGEMLHQYGHSIAARMTGYPMIGIRLWMVLGTSIYPKDEGDLPAAVHIRRAIGGPIFSALLAAVTFIVALVIGRNGGLLWWLVLFFALDNLLVFTLGAMLPLGFTDGSTLLTWWPKR